MIPETAHAQDQPPGWGELQCRADWLLSQYGGVMADAEAGRVAEGRRLSLLTAAFRELRTQLGRTACDEAYIQEAAARAEARGFERGQRAARSGRHRTAGRRGAAVIPLKPARGGTFAVAALAMLAAATRTAGHQARRVLAAAPHHGAIAAASGLAAAGTATIVVLSVQTNLTPYSVHLPVQQQPTAVARAQVVPAYAAPSAATLGHKHSRRPPAAGPSAVVSLPPVSPSASPSPPATAAAGTLDVTEEAITLKPAGPGQLAGQVTLTAAGGPVTWNASGAAGLTLSAWDGTIPAGQVDVITVTVAAAAGQETAGSAVITLYPGGQQVQVTWGRPA